MKRGNEWCANHRHVFVCLAAPRDAGYACALTCMCCTLGPAFFSFTFSVNVQGTIVRSVVHVDVRVMRTPHKAESSRLTRLLLRSSQCFFFMILF